MDADDVIVIVLLLGLLVFVALIIAGLVFITEPLFQNNNIVLTDINLAIAKMAIIMSWLSLPITIVMTYKILMKVAKNPISLGILVLGLLTLLSFVVYGLTILSISLFQQDGVYINKLPIFPPIQPPSPKVYKSTLTINCLKLATIFAWLSISWNVFFFVKEIIDF